MKKSILTVAALFLAAPAFATTYPALIEELSQSQIAQLQRELAAKATRQTGGIRLKDFHVDWERAQCMEVANEMDPNARLGVCTVPFGALQLAAVAAIVKSDRGLETRIIYADVE